MPHVLHWLNGHAIPWQGGPRNGRGAPAEPFRFGMSESAQQTAKAGQAMAVYSRLVLTAGFGGLLLLMGFAGFDAIQTIRHIQKSNDDIRVDFLARTRVLEQIRSDLYLSGTYVRDYLLEPESQRAESHRASLLETRNDMDRAVRKYETLLNTEESRPFGILTRELGSYWSVLEPV